MAQGMSDGGGEPFSEPVGTNADARPCAPAWRFLCLAQVRDFAALRRLLGRARAELFTEDIVGRVRAITAQVDVVAVDHRTIEIAFFGDGSDDLNPILAALVRGFAHPFTIDGSEHRVSIAIGAAGVPTDAADGLHVIEQAESALVAARTSGNPYVRIDPECDHAIGQVDLARELPAAITGDQMVLHYQPKVHLRRQEVASVEALIRWQHPERGLIFPGAFIALAEELCLVHQMTLWVISRVIADQAMLRLSGHDPTIFINVSGQLLSDAGFVAAASALVRDSQVNIGFEVTETSVIRDPQSAIANLKKFAAAGITISIDDYGAGLSSLAYLKQLPARELKIDKLFITQLASSNRDPLIVRSTIDLAHALEMEVVAEGVETAAALALLTVMGCDMAQGFLISRPIELDALIRFLDEKPFHEVGQTGRFAIGRLVSSAKRAIGQ